MHRGLDNCLGLIYSVSGINSSGKFGDSLQKFPKPPSFQKFRQIYGFGKIIGFCQMFRDAIYMD